MNNLKESPVITIHVNAWDKEALFNLAQKNGMQLATYCRMLLLKSLEATK